jgi:predicted DNA-binding transcriptional regulator AlpA
MGMSNEIYIGINEVCKITGLTRRSIYNMEKTSFPRRAITVGEKAIPVYLKREVEAWAAIYKANKNNINKRLGLYDILINDIIVKQSSSCDA